MTNYVACQSDIIDHVGDVILSTGLLTSFTQIIKRFSSIKVFVHILWLKMQSVQNDKNEEIKQNFAHAYLGIGWHDLL